jgi:hypothetical protein
MIASTGMFVSAVVVDGVTLGRPTCGVHNCKEPLQHNRHRFCELHSSEGLICCFPGCRNTVRDGA